MKIITAVLGVAIITFLFVLVLGAIMALPTMWLWNFVVPYISNHTMPAIGFWHAFALNVLCGILFKSSSTTKSSDD